MLAPGPYALLAVGRALEILVHGVGQGPSQKDGLELVHAGVGEEQGGVVQRHAGGGWDERVREGGEVGEESGADLGGRPERGAVVVAAGQGGGEAAGCAVSGR